MPVDTEHPQYARRKEQWEKLRDCNEGQEIIHLKTTKYLPRLSGQSNEDYEAYLKRGVFYGATSRTVDGLTGMVFRKPPMIEVPEGLKGIIEDITLDGLGIVGFAEEIVDDSIVVGRSGILVDHPVTPPNASRAQAEAQNLRPFLRRYTAENIFNWKTESRNNAQVVTEVRLYEQVELRGQKEFDVSFRKQIRVLDLNDVGQYRQRVFVKRKVAAPNGEMWEQLGLDIIPLKNGIPLNFVPFYFVGVKNSSPTVEKPPLIDLANVNLSHYRSTADLEHGAHFTGLPTAIVTGHQDDPEKPAEYRIGSANAWVFPNPETRVSFLEFQGQGLEALEKRIDKKEQYMAFLGARMLTPEKKAVETAETAQIHRSGETSVLSSLAQSVSKSIEDALKFMAEWAGFSGEIKFNLNNDFSAVKMAPDELIALLKTWQSGGIAFSDFLDNLKKGEIVHEDRTEDEIRSEIEQNNPFSGEDLTGGNLGAI